MFSNDLIEANCIQTNSKRACDGVVPVQNELLARRFQAVALIVRAGYSSERPRVTRLQPRER